MDYLAAAAQRVAPVASAKLEQAAHTLYDACPSVKPAWGQLGEVTKGVWRDKARLKLAGHPRWWSHDPDNVSTLMNAVSAPRIRGALQECIKMSLNHKKVAEQLDAISEAFMALAGSFRSGGVVGEDSSGDGEAAKPVRGAKSAPAKAASKPAAKKAQAEQDEELSIDTVREKLKELVEAKGKEKMVEALESVGAGKLADVDESQYQELMDAAQAMIDEEDEPEEKPAKKPAAKKAGKAKAVTLDELTAAAKELIEADKAAFVKLSKKFGKPSECDEDTYADYLKAIQAAMPEEGGEEDDDLL